MGSAPPPYAEPTCRINGCPNPPAVLAGRYRGLCVTHKDDIVAEQRERRLAEGNGSAREEGDRVEPGAKIPRLSRTVKDLVPIADRLEKSIKDREVARIHAVTVLGQFKAQLAVVTRVAQSLINHHTPQKDEA